tara:strand:+ start:276 stop:527 length:252 start_codon:yes stop_codon:yes gene_type:complete
MAKGKSSEEGGVDLDNLERIPRRPEPFFDEQDESVGLVRGMMSSGGIFQVAFLDTNQYGPHAMIVMLFGFAAVTGSILYLLSL